MNGFLPDMDLALESRNYRYIVSCQCGDVEQFIIRDPSKYLTPRSGLGEDEAQRKAIAYMKAHIKTHRYPSETARRAAIRRNTRKNGGHVKIIRRDIPETEQGPAPF